jgi:glycosyltransferase involved in cell wall biosynthesis
VSESLIVHTSTSQVGGAELSLLEALTGDSRRLVFLLPAPGPLAEELRKRGWEYRIVPWPEGLAAFTQRGWWLAPLMLPGLTLYLGGLRRHLAGAGQVRSSGIKSHAACLCLSPWLGSRLLFDIRDFIRPVLFRRCIALAARMFACRVTANSRAVARDYPRAEVAYPLVRLERPPESRRARDGKRIIVHLAYFAPYKGQDLFLEYARKILDKGVDAEFWVIGEVIYPAPAYARYRDRILALSRALGLAGHVRFLGKVGKAGEVQTLLERAHLLLHCTREPEPYGRAVMEALLCGCEAVCHRDSGVCEVTSISRDFPAWMAPLAGILGGEFVRVTLRSTPASGLGSQ